ncbi:cache domain-containing sensor histidine kinase [Aquibacillus koreensis]|uniref:cache domain-containing sensor histidine kinase n=1 Tax=Aquibacillus koreensis TaxID=279446 RepID=UPI00234017AF|nr:sensor histidine kinase [Aquibacillus koreensis]
MTVGNVKEQKMDDLSLSLEQISNDLQEGIDDAVSVSHVLYTDNMLDSFLERRYEETIDFVLAYNTYYRDVSKYAPIYSFIHSISLYTENETAIYAGGIYEINEEVKQTEWYQKTVESPDMSPVLTRSKGDADELDTFSVTRELGLYENSPIQKIIKIDLSLAVIEQIFDSATFHGDVYLLNENGEIEYTNNPNVNWLNGKLVFNPNRYANNGVMIETGYTAQYMDNWRLVGIVAENELLEDVQTSRKSLFLITFLNFVIPSAVIIFITSNLHIRLSNIIRHIRKVEKQNFDIIKGKQYRDEIGVLTSEFNRMSLKIKGLINDVYVASIQKKDLELQSKRAQLSAMQSQINPHFLFNVLETIRMRSLIKKEDETAKIIQNMAMMLRRSFIWGKDWVTVEEEVYLIKCFLEIQYYRFDDKMKYYIDVEPEANEAVIPNMMLIPFVENASIHGIEAMKGSGVINIKISLSDNRLICEIKDDGVGMEEEKYNSILKSLQEEEYIGEHVGIKNVYYRLKLHYKDQFKFELKSKKDIGTTVRISIPVDKDKNVV